MLRFSILIPIICFLSAPAWGQVQMYDLKVTPQAAISIVNLLAGTGPWNVVDPLIRDLQNQIAVQNQAAQEAAMKAIRDQIKKEGLQPAQ